MLTPFDWDNSFPLVLTPSYLYQGKIYDAYGKEHYKRTLNSSQIALFLSAAKITNRLSDLSHHMVLLEGPDDGVTLRTWIDSNEFITLAQISGLEILQPLFDMFDRRCNTVVLEGRKTKKKRPRCHISRPFQPPMYG